MAGAAVVLYDVAPVEATHVSLLVRDGGALFESSGDALLAFVATRVG